MQLVAREMSLSETAFVSPREGRRTFDLRWFTPSVEVDLCGHATLASAHVLWDTGRLDAKSAARFPHAERRAHGDAARGAELDRRSISRRTPRRRRPLPDGIEGGARRRSSTWTGRSRFDVLVELPSEDAVRALAPDLAALAKVEGRGFIVTARGSGTYDFVSRFFAPRVGVAEDPVTGSAHCVLGPYWASRLGKRELTGYQASERGGVVHVSLYGERVTLGGRGVTVARGELVAPGG